MNQNNWACLSAATAAVFTGLVFLRAVWHKLANVESFRGIVVDYRIVPQWAVPGASLALIAVEVLITLSVVWPDARHVGACLAIVVLLAYTGAMATNILRGRKGLECGCGAPSQRLSWSLVVRNVALMSVAALILLSNAAARLSMMETMVSISCAFVLWICFVVMEQIQANSSHASPASEVLHS